MIYVNYKDEILCPFCEGLGKFEVVHRKSKDETYYVCDNCEIVTNDLDKLKNYKFVAGDLSFYIKRIKGELFNKSDFDYTGKTVEIDENETYSYTTNLASMSIYDCTFEKSKIAEIIYPMGTVVRLKDEAGKLTNQLYMITDRFVWADKIRKQYYEYRAIIYPLGHQDGKVILFNNEQIGKLEFTGYETQEDRVILEKVLNRIKEKGITKKK